MYDEKDETFWDKPKTENAELWDASEFSQQNPLFTDHYGAYAWDVPEGWWQVKYEKDGYETTYSDWLPVPPPQTEVNIGIVSKEQPEVISTDIVEDSLIIEFSKYIDPETISNIEIKDRQGNALTYSIEYDQSETSLNGTIYAKTFKLCVANGLDIKRLIVPNRVQSYAGINAVEYNADIVPMIMGDVNDDGQLSTKDVSLLKRYLAEGWGVEINLEAADMDKDGKITTKDVTLLKRRLAGGWEIY